MGRVKHMAFGQLLRARSRSTAGLDEFLADLDHQPVPSIYLPPKPRKGVQRVVVENDYLGRLPQRDQVQLDESDTWEFNFAQLLLAPQVIFTRTVPAGQAWFLDDFYFFATCLGGLTNSIMLGQLALLPYFVFIVQTSSSQLRLDTLGTLAAAGQPGQSPRGSLPFLNDRVGSRQAVFGVTLFEGEDVTASVMLRNPAVVPPVALNRIGFRICGIECTKHVVEEYLRRHRWDA